MDQITSMAVATLLFLGVIVFAAGKNEISIRKQGAISCGPAQSGNGQNPWPKDGGNGCAHQSVSAAFLGRNKREKMHGC